MLSTPTENFSVEVLFRGRLGALWGNAGQSGACQISFWRGLQNGPPQVMCLGSKNVGFPGLRGVRACGPNQQAIYYWGLSWAHFGLQLQWLIATPHGII